MIREKYMAMAQQSFPKITARFLQCLEDKEEFQGLTEGMNLADKKVLEGKVVTYNNWFTNFNWNMYWSTASSTKFPAMLLMHSELNFSYLHWNFEIYYQVNHKKSILPSHRLRCECVPVFYCLNTISGLDFTFSYK